MYTTGSYISCGIRELVIGRGRPTQEKLEDVINNASCAMLITTIEAKRKSLLKLLNDNGFKQVGVVTRAPCGKDYRFLVRYMKPAEIKRARFGY